MLIYRKGTPVVFDSPTTKGHINKAEIDGNEVCYNVIYFKNGEHQSCWLREYEFTVDVELQKQKIGFKK